MNFSQGHSVEPKFHVNRDCFPKEKHQNSQKWEKSMNFRFGPFFGLFGLPGRLLIIDLVFYQQLPRETPEMITSYDLLEPLNKQY